MVGTTEDTGYKVDVAFLWLSSADLAIRRVADRARMGGHTVPEETVRRRYRSGIRNFFELYRPIASNWRVYDSTSSPPRIIARGGQDQPTDVYDKQTWERIAKENDDEKGR